MFSDYAGTTMLENGRDIIEGTNGIKETSVECSVFGSSTGSDTGAFCTAECSRNSRKLSFSKTDMGLRQRITPLSNPIISIRTANWSM